MNKFIVLQKSLSRNMGVQEKISAVRCLVVSSQHSSYTGDQIPNPRDQLFLTGGEAQTQKVRVFKHIAKGRDLSLTLICCH